MVKIGFIGCGNMGGALAKAVAKNEFTLMLCDKDESKAEALAEQIGAKATSSGEVCAECDYVFLGVKPHLVFSVLSELAPLMKDNAVIISMAAGVDIKRLEEAAPGKAIIRIMPSTPAAYGKGVILADTNGFNDIRLTIFKEFIAPAGMLDMIPESLIDAGSAVSGCGPAFVYMFIEAMADGGVAAGLPRDKALKYAAMTVIGAAETLIGSGKHPGELKDAVCSPGGSTIEGVITLEECGMRGAVSDAVRAAFEKTKKLGK